MIDMTVHVRKLNRIGIKTIINNNSYNNLGIINDSSYQVHANSMEEISL